MHPTQGVQCELATSLYGVWPYSRWIGSSGQIEEHHPLLPFSSMPPMKPPVSAPSSSSALAGPESSRPTLRSETKRMNIPAAITKPYSLSQSGAVSALERPSRRGVWLEAESGQTLRHSPGTTSHSSGSTGMMSFHRTKRPSSGATTSAMARPIAPSSVTTRMSCHAPTGRRAGICV